MALSHSDITFSLTPALDRIRQGTDEEDVDDALHDSRPATAPRRSPWLRAHEGDPSADRRAGEHREHLPRACASSARGAGGLDAESAGGGPTPRAVRDHRRREPAALGLALEHPHPTARAL